MDKKVTDTPFVNRSHNVRQLGAMYTERTVPVPPQEIWLSPGRRYGNSVKRIFSFSGVVPE